MRSFSFLALSLLGCSQTQPVKDSGPPVGLACSDAVNGCACVTAAPPAGACSPASLGGSGHCCAHSQSGKVDNCYCAKDGTCFTQNMVCTCNALPTPDGGMVAATCPKPMNGHCCKTITDAAQGECHCGSGMCAMMTETEVMACSGSDGNLNCGSDTMSVPTCQ